METSWKMTTPSQWGIAVKVSLLTTQVASVALGDAATELLILMSRDDTEKHSTQTEVGLACRSEF